MALFFSGFFPLCIEKIKKNRVSATDSANETSNWATILVLAAIPSLTVQDSLTQKLHLFKAHKMQIKCQDDFPRLASSTTCRPFKIKQGKCL